MGRLVIIRHNGGKFDLSDFFKKHVFSRKHNYAKNIFYEFKSLKKISILIYNFILFCEVMITKTESKRNEPGSEKVVFNLVNFTLTFFLSLAVTCD